MRILVACEESGVVRDAFRCLGHDAWSCDLTPTSSSDKRYHLIGDVLDYLGGWGGSRPDLLIAHPPCTHLSVSGALHFKKKIADGRQQRAIEFFMKMANANIEKIAVENPVSIMSTKWRKPDQIIQPFQFGHPESKKTCLWLKNLPLLTPTSILPIPACGYWENQTPSGQNKLGPSADRAKIRSKTYPGIAKAMAEQWGDIVEVEL